MASRSGATLDLQGLQPQGGTACESIQTILNIAVTAEALAVAALGNALDSAQKGNLALNAEQQQTLTAIRFTEQRHYEVLIAAGAQPLTTTFTLPDTKILTDVPTFLNTIIPLEDAFQSAYDAAAQEFAIQGHPELVRLAIQFGAVECEHLAIARLYAIEAGIISGVPNNVAFENALFTSVGQAAAALQQLGFIGGNGPQFSYPGPGAITNPGVKNVNP